MKALNMRTVCAISLISAAVGVAGTVATQSPPVAVPKIDTHSHASEIPPDVKEDVPLVEYTGDDCQLNNHAAW